MDFMIIYLDSLIENFSIYRQTPYNKTIKSDGPQLAVSAKAAQGFSISGIYYFFAAGTNSVFAHTVLDKPKDSQHRVD